VGISSATLALNPYLKNFSYARLNQPLIPSGEQFVNSICQACPAGCGIKVKILDGKAIKIFGNPIHPLNQGKLCPKGEAGLQILYDPDRIAHPMKRLGYRGKNQWQKITWDEGIDILYSRLKYLRDANKPDELATLIGEKTNLTTLIMERFLNSLGSPYNIKFKESFNGGPVPPSYMAQNLEEGIIFDIENSDYVISFNSGLLESNASPVHTSLNYGKMRSTIEKARGHMVSIEPRLSITAAKSDEWIPIHPNTEGAFAMGIIYLMIVEGLYDRNFISENVDGFEDVTISQIGFKNFVLNEYPLDKVSKICGVAPELIVKIAREFATAKAPLAIFSDRIDVLGKSFYDRFAIYNLNVIVGNLNKPGGILVKRKFDYNLPNIEFDHVNKFSNFDILKTFIEKRKKFSTILIYDTDPLFSLPIASDIKKVLEKTDFIVSFSSFINETSMYADLILPDDTYLEKWQDHLSYTNQGYPIFSVGMPCVKKRKNTKNSCDVILKIAQLFGSTIQKSLPWKNYDELLDYTLNNLFNQQRGSPLATKHELSWTRFLEQTGWRANVFTDYQEFKHEIFKTGGWTDPVYLSVNKAIYKTKNNKLQIISDNLNKFISTNSILQSSKFSAYKINKDNNKFYMPHYEKITQIGNPDDYPFTLILFPLMTHIGLTTTNQAFLQDVSGFYVNKNWKTWVEISHETLKKIKINDSDIVWVISQFGKFKAQVKSFKGIMPNVVAVPIGLGKTVGGRWEAGIGENPISIIAPVHDPITGEFINGTTRVKIERA
jgi:anaerobic selenocysteine-containing dehydrogenase